MTTLTDQDIYIGTVSYFIEEFSDYFDIALEEIFNNYKNKFIDKSEACEDLKQLLKDFSDDYKSYIEGNEIDIKRLNYSKLFKTLKPKY